MRTKEKDNHVITCARSGWKLPKEKVKGLTFFGESQISIFSSYLGCVFGSGVFGCGLWDGQWLIFCRCNPTFSHHHYHRNRHWRRGQCWSIAGRIQICTCNPADVADNMRTQLLLSWQIPRPWPLPSTAPLLWYTYSRDRLLRPCNPSQGFQLQPAGRSLSDRSLARQPSRRPTLLLWRTILLLRRPKSKPRAPHRWLPAGGAIILSQVTLSPESHRRQVKSIRPLKSP